MQWKDQTFPSTLDRTWLVVGRRTLAGHVHLSAHHFGGAQRSTRGSSGSTSCSTNGKVDTSCPTSSVISVQAGCTAPPARRTTMLLEQMRQMQAQNQREFARLEQQGAADNAATVVTGGQSTDTPIAIAGPSHSTSNNGDQRPPESIAIAGPSSSHHAVPDTQTNSSTSRVTPTGSLPSVISDTSDPSRSVSPADLQADSQPVRRLRKDLKSSTAADQFLKDIGYLSSQGNSNSESSPADGLWPENYVNRLTGNETLPRGVDLAALRRHFSYLRSLMVDCSEVNWVTARTAHKQVLLGIHYRRFTWLDQRACVDAKRDAIQRILRIPREAVPKALPTPEVVITPCPLYQSENCQLATEHTTDGITYTHC